MKTKLLIFGITGDLSRRKLLPSLEQIISTGDFDDLSVIGVSRGVIDKSYVFANCKDENFLNDKLSTFSMDLSNLDDYRNLKQFINLSDDEQLLIYLAVPPHASLMMVELLGLSGLNTSNVKVLFEKPFGTDLNTAKEMIEHTARYYQEEQVYRIDHFLAKEMAQNIVTFRGRNALFSNIWSSEFIESIEIVAIEAIGIEGRAQFYEQTGALRDVLQGHLMQLLALTLMDIPPSLEWNDLQRLRVDAINHLIMPDMSKIIRGQYESYKDEVSNQNSSVETFVAIELASSHSRWSGVPIKLITGKAMNEKTTEIRINLKKTNEAQSNCLIFRIQPNEGVDIKLFVKKPGYGHTFEARHLSFNYPNGTVLPDAYERVLVDAINSRKSLFTSNQEVIRSWQILQPVIDGWRDNGDNLKLYKIGSKISDILA